MSHGSKRSDFLRATGATLLAVAFAPGAALATARRAPAARTATRIPARYPQRGPICEIHSAWNPPSMCPAFGNVRFTVPSTVLSALTEVVIT